MATTTHLLDDQDDVFDQPPAAVAAPTQPAQEQPEPPANPAVALLKSMFPDFDDIVLQSVLDSVNGNQDAAVDVLLGMSDPSYVSTHHAGAGQTGPTADTSLDLDEALARQLQLEDEQAHQQQARGQTWQPRRRDANPAAAQAQGQPGAPQGQGDNMQEIKETFNQLAESGKRTFSSIVSRVKAKINEYDQNRPNNAQSQSQHPPPNWGSGSTSQQQPSAQSSPNPASYPTYYAEAPAQPVDRHSASQAYARYYNHEADEDDEGWQAVSGRGWTTETKPVTEQPKPVEVKGYDIDPPSLQPTPAAAPSTVASSPPEQHEPIAAVTESPGSDVLKPPATQSGSPLNAAKFGLLPKRPVSLLTPQTSATKQPSEDDEDDELEYAENPFEEARH